MQQPGCARQQSRSARGRCCRASVQTGMQWSRCSTPLRRRQRQAVAATRRCGSHPAQFLQRLRPPTLVVGLCCVSTRARGTHAGVMDECTLTMTRHAYLNKLGCDELSNATRCPSNEHQCTRFLMIQAHGTFDRSAPQRTTILLADSTLMHRLRLMDVHRVLGRPKAVAICC